MSGGAMAINFGTAAAQGRWGDAALSLAMMGLASRGGAWGNLAVGSYAVGSGLNNFAQTGDVVQLGLDLLAAKGNFQAAGRGLMAPRTTNGKLLQTGGQYKTLHEYDADQAFAARAYESIRASTTDVQAISDNTGMPVGTIQRIKEHVFLNEHQLFSGKGPFDPHPEIARAWARLENGQATPNDLKLLQHERFEAKFEGIFKTDAATAHDATLKSGRVWDPEG